MQWELAGRPLEARRRYRGLVRNSPETYRRYRGFAGSSQRVIGGLLGVHRELVEGDQELVENAPRVRQKMTETCREFAITSYTIAGLDSIVVARVLASTLRSGVDSSTGHGGRAKAREAPTVAKDKVVHHNTKAEWLDIMRRLLEWEWGCSATKAQVRKLSLELVLAH
ncbi:hypothetical protein GW17_00003732 [Ensete ventricosum]|nr:hypothetical protein GW17_00003732 [Ensete ventricosum]